ncbi:hypothetical protein MKZ38_000884 [Zalerion maritima]|uniref:magnesium chelatase n=1 Tax=Zalerion maritima TaxID=339359 RepID=A0AAD5RXR4_9PEZI|nr:hypothetical protein MKZ38_000884 [Zalerion maritima]
MADDILLAKLHGVSDLELATLLSLICRQHCIVSTEPDDVDRLAQELQLITAHTFALKPIVLDCHHSTSLEDFAAGIQLPPSLTSPTPRPASPYHRQSHLHAHNPQASFGHASYHSGRLAPRTSTATGDSRWPASPVAAAGEVANVVLAKNLDLAPKAVQIQALELLRTRRLFTRSNVLVAPRSFLLIAVLSAPFGGEARLTPHLNDFFYLAHWHDSDDGFMNLEAEWDSKGKGKDAVPSSSSSDDDTASFESVVRTKRGSYSDAGGGRDGGHDGEPLFTEHDISTLANLSQDVSVDVDVIRYQMNLVSFLRLHRAVAGGISPTATKHFGQLMRCLAPLHGLDFVTPSLVALAAKKVYLHRIRVVTPEKERSMQWGSDVRAIKEILQDVGPEDIIDDVLHMVATPL